jgi:glutathione peroxidase
MKAHLIASLFVALSCVSAGFASGPGDAATIYDFKMKNIDGKDVKLSKYKGKVLLVVNVASHCGYTPQYKALEEVYNTYRSKGVVVLGFPANNFGAQEPGSDVEIKQFCTATYNVTFPMFSKISVKGDDQAELYHWLIANSDRPNDDIEWNFSKFVVGKDGKVLKRFKSQSKPDSPEVEAALEEALKQ